MKIYEITVENADQPGLPAPLGETNAVMMASSIHPMNAQCTWQLQLTFRRH